MSSVLPHRTRAEVDAEIRGVNQLWPSRTPLDEGRHGWTIRHGTDTGYGEGCRCSACLHARREYLRSRGGDRRADLRGS